MLQLRIVQGRGCRQHQEFVEEGSVVLRHMPDVAHHYVCSWLLCLQKHIDRLELTMHADYHPWFCYFLGLGFRYGKRISIYHS